MRKRTQARECALQMLYQHEMNDALPEETAAAFWQEHADFPPEVREFAEALFGGTLEHREALDRTVAQAAENWNLARMAVVDRNILRLAAYELLYTPELPPKVAINEAVNLAKKFSQEEAGKFVNGVLDKIHHTPREK